MEIRSVGNCIEQAKHESSQELHNVGLGCHLITLSKPQFWGKEDLGQENENIYSETYPRSYLETFDSCNQRCRLSA